MLDTAVKSIVFNRKLEESSLEPEECEFERYKKRVQSYKEWKEKHILKIVKAGDRVDIRDTEHIWCSGMVELKISTENRHPLLYVHYDVSVDKSHLLQGWNRKYDEYVYMNSERLAPAGTYTIRNDIPRYSVNPQYNRDMMQASIIEMAG